MRTMLMAVVLLLLAAACKKNNVDCSQYNIEPITDVRYMGTSNTGIRGQDAAFFDVSCTFQNTCSTIYQFIPIIHGRSIIVKAGALYRPCANCTTLNTPQTRTFSFVPPAGGAWYITWEGLPNRVDTIYIP
ncbi:hypothetical protein ACDQ55_10385 [Chitinophaga sp. 30R24]|uniref:hypothetical protein n=1 Tax=Chitinophaga sp. 30R24 TaxID=3248838 RepID=UPI003B9196BA